MNASLEAEAATIEPPKEQAPNESRVKWVIDTDRLAAYRAQDKVVVLLDHHNYLKSGFMITVTEEEARRWIPLLAYATGMSLKGSLYEHDAMYDSEILAIKAGLPKPPAGTWQPHSS